MSNKTEIANIKKRLGLFFEEIIKKRSLSIYQIRKKTRLSGYQINSILTSEKSYTIDSFLSIVNALDLKIKISTDEEKFFVDLQADKKYAVSKDYKLLFSLVNEGGKVICLVPEHENVFMCHKKGGKTIAVGDYGNVSPKIFEKFCEKAQIQFFVPC